MQSDSWDGGYPKQFSIPGMLLSPQTSLFDLIQILCCIDSGPFSFLSSAARYRYAGTEVTTLVTHFFGDIDSMRKELMMVIWLT